MEGMDREHLVVNCTIDDQGNEIHSHALIDFIATGFAFIDEEMANCHGLLLFSFKNLRELQVIDRQPIQSGLVTTITKVTLTIEENVEEIPMMVPKLGHYPVVLGIRWLNKHNVSLHFQRKTFNFDSNYCLHYCSPVSASTKGISIPVLKGKRQTKK